MWKKLNDGWRTAIVICLFIVGVVGLLCVAYHYDSNGVRVRTNNLYSHEAPKDMEMPIEIVGIIEYDDDYIYRRERIVEFCNVKEAKKEMRQEMKVFWKEMKQGCK